MINASNLSAERVGQLLRAAGPFVLLAALAAGLTAYGVSLSIPPVFQATVQLFVSPVASPSVALQEVVLGQNLARSYVTLANAEIVLRPAMQEAGLTDLDRFRERTHVAQVRDTFVINISFDADDRTRAATIANRIAESFVGESRKLQSALQGTVTIWQPATPPDRPESPRVGLNTLLGSLTGAFAAIVILAARAYLDDRLGDFDRVRTRLGITPLEEIEQSPRPETTTGKLFVRDDAQSREAEAFRSLRTNIAFSNVDRRPQTLLITSALPAEGKSVVSANLALAFAQEGTPTVLIDADLRRPSQHRFFGTSGTSGLTTLLAGSPGPEAWKQFRIAANLTVIPSGPLPPNPAELLQSRKMTELLRSLIAEAPDCVIVIDTSPVLAVADALVLSTKVDGCLLVVDATRTNARAARRALERLRAVNATIVGAVLNKARGTTHGYYGYGPSSARK